MAIEDKDIAALLAKNLKATALGVAALRGYASDLKKLSPEEELLMFNATAKGWSPEQELEMLASGKSPVEVGLAKYPHRMKLAASGVRALDKAAQYTYMADMARKSDPTWQPSPPLGSQEPDEGVRHG